MPLLDLKSELGHLYKPSPKVPSVVDVPPLRFLMLDGVGGVGGDDFQDAIRTLYGLAYPVKFAAKKQLDLAYPVMPLEGLYSDPQGESEFTTTAAADLAWRLMILLPDAVPGELVDETRAVVAAKKDLPRLADVRVQTFSEGRSVQIMHIGPYDKETPTVNRLLAFAAEKGFAVTGLHHEIYIGDPNKAAPEKLKTVLRYGVSRRAR